ncbi:hypothetical protein [Stenotrophomonas maltophilia]|uniref:hypothetical protein n=1 Tax=Stenotrophomonas maltophilia TaxID=40324 RepID=UPI0020A375B0|nr:hypothetical protein [Stenotrophomonas maltophilia]
MAIQDLDVLFAIDRAGVVGPDGATHAGNLDLSFLRCVPNLVVMAPSNEAECRQMLSTGLQHPAQPPCATRAAPAPALQPAPTCPPCRSQGRTAPAGQPHCPARLRQHRGRRRAGRPRTGLSGQHAFIKPLDRELVLAVAAQHEAW